MSVGLSIEAAARECPERIALIAKGRSYTYQDLANLANDVVLPPVNLHRASATVDTALLLYASLQRQSAIAFVSPSLSDAEFDLIRLQLEEANQSTSALILFTSGSSGTSKGVLLDQDALAASALAAGEVLGWEENDRWLCCLPLSHIGGLSILLRCLLARRTAVLCDAFEADVVAQALTAHRITQISLVPTMLWRLLQRDVRAPEFLRVTLMGGAALHPDLARRATDAGFRLRASYGMTETASMVVCDGHPLPGVHLKIRDDTRLLIRGPMVMQGYLRPSDEAPPLQGGWFETSDRARFDGQGLLEILGRSDDTVISGGENVDLPEVEAVLRDHPQVLECLAVGVPDPEWGQKLVALVVCTGEPSEIVCERLSGHKRPKLLIKVDNIPLLENGKVDRRTAVALAQNTQT